MYGDPDLNTLVIPSVKALAKTSTSSSFFFPKILSSPFVIVAVYTDKISPSVYADRITKGFISVGKYHRKLLIEIFLVIVVISAKLHQTTLRGP